VEIYTFGTRSHQVVTNKQLHVLEPFLGLCKDNYLKPNKFNASHIACVCSQIRYEIPGTAACF
jgi:hypothetical protein